MTLLSGVPRRRFLPDVAGQRVSRHDLIFMAHEVFQKFKFPHGQFHALSAADDFSGNQIHIEIADAQMKRVFGPASPQQCADAGKKFGECERFHQIVVGAAVQSMHTILKSVARGQQENRSFEPALADCGEHLNAVAARQHPIEKNEVELGGIDLKERLFTGGRNVSRHSARPRDPPSVHWQLFVRLQRPGFARGRIVPITANSVRTANAPPQMNVADGPVQTREVRQYALAGSSATPLTRLKNPNAGSPQFGRRASGNHGGQQSLRQSHVQAPEQDSGKEQRNAGSESQREIRNDENDESCGEQIPMAHAIGQDAGGISGKAVGDVHRNHDRGNIRRQSGRYSAPAAPETLR